MDAPVVIKVVNVGPDIAFGVCVIGVPFVVDPFAFQASKETLHWCVDAPMSSRGRRIGQIGQNERVQLPDDIALQAAVDFLV
jgi:hypothetical protein